MSGAAACTAATSSGRRRTFRVGAVPLPRTTRCCRFGRVTPLSSGTREVWHDLWTRARMLSLLFAAFRRRSLHRRRNTRRPAPPSLPSGRTRSKLPGHECPVHGALVLELDPKVSKVVP